MEIGISSSRCRWTQIAKEKKNKKKTFSFLFLYFQRKQNFSFSALTYFDFQVIKFSGVYLNVVQEEEEEEKDELSFAVIAGCGTFPFFPSLSLSLYSIPSFYFISPSALC